MDFALTESQELIKKETAALARSFSLDYWLDKDDKAEYPHEFVKAFADNGWLGLMVPEEYGGAGLGVTEAALMLHEICASGAGTSGASPIHFYIFPPTPVIKFGTEAMKRKHLPSICTGETVMAFGVTEPNAGTDTSRIQTRAEKHGDKWIVNGRKVWTTNAQHANKILLLARTSERDPKKPLKGMTLFFTAFDRKAISVRLIHKLGRAAVDSNEIAIENLEIPSEDVVGTVGEGFYHLLESLNPERIVIGIEAVGIGRAALDRAVQYAQGAHRLRPADREEPGHRPSPGACLGRARRRGGDVPQGGLALRQWPALRQGGQCRQAPVRRGGLQCLRRGAADLRRLRLCQGVLRGAPLARGTPVQDRAGVPADGAQLSGRARARAAALLLIACPGPWR